MTPIYFPFSLLSPRAAAHLAACFPAMGLYLPVESVGGQVVNFCGRPGFLELRVPESGLDRAVDDLYRAAMQWKTATLGAEVSFVKAWEKGRISFFDEATISRLRKDILRHGSKPRESLDDLMEARLFLRLALDHDLREAELICGIGALEEKEKNLFEALRGDDDEADADLSDEVLGRSISGPAGDPGARMTAERVRAWAIAAACDTAPSAVFVTDSCAVMEYIQERCPTMAPVANITGVPLLDAVTDPAALKKWQAALSSFFEELVYGRACGTPLAVPPFCRSATGGAEAMMLFFKVPDVTAHTFLKFFAPQAVQGIDSSGGDKAKNIIIGQLSIT